MSAPTETIAAIATAAGRGGIGIVRVSGPAVDVVMAGVIGHRVQPRHATVATFVDAAGATIDRGVALFFPGPASYTGESILELHGHGGHAVLTLLLRRCLELGARLAEPGEFTKRAFLNGKIDLAQAEGVADMIDASTAIAARAAARSLTGEFSNEIHALVADLVTLRVFTEATLDFPEEDIDFIRAADAAGKLRRLRERVDAVLARARQGSLLREGLDVVLVGQPNVGKSSLLNRLVGDDAAIVTPVPGTTRDAVRRTVEIGGIPLHVIDTAGLRDTIDVVERLGIARTWDAIEHADLALIIVDASNLDERGEDWIVARLPATLRRIFVHNKIDLSATSSRRARDDVWLSAKTGEGIELLRAAILDVADVHESMEGTFLARERHLRALVTAETCLGAAGAHLEHSTPALELFAEELRLAQEALGSITGEFGADDLLGAIFSRFCIGK
jgi:tRNA modification GTPase